MRTSEMWAHVDIEHGPSAEGLLLELTHLRAETEIQHRQIERRLDLLRLSFTQEQYVALLRKFHGFHQPWESAVGPILEQEIPGFFQPRRKLEKLKADLRFLGSDDVDLLRIPNCQKLPALNSIGSALGSMYVIEGSSLGGRILTRHFGNHLGLRPDGGCMYFSGYGDGTGAMWSAFGALVASRPPAEDADMLRAAVSTFELFGEWMTGNAAHA